jgi:hypothetical protein
MLQNVCLVMLSQGEAPDCYFMMNVELKNDSSNFDDKNTEPIRVRRNKSQIVAVNVWYIIKFIAVEITVKEKFLNPKSPL